MNWKTVKSYLEQHSLAKYIEALGKAGFGIAEQLREQGMAIKDELT